MDIVTIISASDHNICCVTVNINQHEDSDRSRECNNLDSAHASLNIQLSFNL